METPIMNPVPPQFDPGVVQPIELKKSHKKVVIEIIILLILALMLGYLALMQPFFTNLIGFFTNSKTTNLENLQIPQLKLLAATTTVLQTKTNFTIPDLPNVQFEILQVSKASGIKSNSECPNGPSIYMQYSDPITIDLGDLNKTEKEICSDGRFEISRINDQVVPNFNSEMSNVSVAMNQVKGAIVAVDLAVTNNSEAIIDSQFLNLSYVADIHQGNDFYNTTPTLLLAESYPLWGTYKIPAHTSKVIRVGFLIKENTDEVYLMYGNFKSLLESLNTNPIKLAVGSIDVNFENKTITVSTSTNPIPNQTGPSIDTSAGRDSQRLKDINKIASAIDSYVSNASDQRLPVLVPTSLSKLIPLYLSSVPQSPTPPDGDCTVSNNQYVYQTIDAKRYLLKLCLGDTNGPYKKDVNLVGEFGYPIQTLTLSTGTIRQVADLLEAKFKDNGDGTMTLSALMQSDPDKLIVGKKVTVLDNLRGYHYATTTYSGTIQSKNKASYTITIIMPSKPKFPECLPGMANNCVTVVISAKTNVLLVPLQAILEKDAKKYVYVVIDPLQQVFKSVEVNTGFANDHEIEITLGLSQGQSIVVLPPDPI